MVCAGESSVACPDLGGEKLPTALLHLSPAGRPNSLVLSGLVGKGSRPGLPLTLPPPALSAGGTLQGNNACGAITPYHPPR